MALGYITGIAHSPFTRSDPRPLEEMIVDVARTALADAGLEPAEIDAIFLGHFNGGFTGQDFTAPLVLQADSALRFTPATRVENACATGSAAIFQGLQSIRLGDARHVLVVGVEKMSEVSGREAGDILLRASYKAEEADIEGGFAGVFARVAQNYFQRHGDASRALARIASKNHTNGAANPYAQMRKPLDVAFCDTVGDRNPLVAPPLRRTDCSLVSDGAAALVLSIEPIDDRPTVAFRAAEQVTDFLPLSRRDATLFEGPAEAMRRVREAAGVTNADLGFAEVHDCFTIAELIIYEAMGLAEAGKGVQALDEGTVFKGGALPVNVSGGLKAKGHPVGATGVSMHVVSAMQLRGEAGDMQLPDPELGMVFNMGGAAVANYASVLERVE